MKASTQKPDKHWKSVGFRASLGHIPLDQVLSKVEGVNCWIRAGYEQGERRRRLSEQEPVAAP